MISIPIVSIEEKYIPEYATSGSAGFDLKAHCSEEVLIGPAQTKIIGTGIKVAIPKGYEIQIRPRSGLAAKEGITVLNSPGTIDSDYRGELGVILINHSNTIVRIKDMDRIAQGVLCPVYQVNFLKTDSLDNTERGDGGYGSTGGNNG